MPQNRPAPAQVKHVLQQAVLRNYPNPERHGCPGTTALAQIARRFLPPEDDHWMHILHCSPCYREFLDVRHVVLSVERRRRLMGRVIYTMLALVTAFILVYAVRRG